MKSLHSGVEFLTCALVEKSLVTCRAVCSVAKLSVREGRGAIPGLKECCQRLAISATFVWSCVAQALSRGNGPHHSLHASA